MIASSDVVIGILVFGPLYLLVTGALVASVAGNRRRGRH